MSRIASDLLPIFQSLPQWADIQHIVQCFHKQNYRAWPVGGCVRDVLCGVTPQDIDFATDATPEMVEKLFTHTLHIGKQFGTIIIVLNGRNYEVTSFRSDGIYKDNRHPESIAFGTPKEDANRRDFTCNALFFDTLNNQLVDFVDGVLDIQQKQIRAVGVPEDRFKEDALRLLRTIRFATQLNWSIETNTLQAVAMQKDRITAISVERVRQELFKILLSDHASKGLALLKSTGLFQAFLGPGFPALSLPQICLYGRLEARLATLVHQWPIEDTDQFFKKVKLSKKDRSQILSLSDRARQDMDQLPLADLRQIVGSSDFEDLCSVLKALRKNKALDLLDRIKKMYPELPAPFFSGHDLQGMGFSSGPALGKLLQDLRQAQLNEQVKSKDEALSFLKAQS